MYINTFQGYNCYSSALGEYASNKNIIELQKLILTQWTYFFDREQFLNNQWYTGAADGPVDIILNKDIEQFLDMRIIEHKKTAKQAIDESIEITKDKDHEIVLIDFYYLNSFNWKSLGRFNVTREHDPHFIILTNIDDDNAYIIDPYYHHKEIMKLEDFMAARNSVTKQGKIYFNSYEIDYRHRKDVNIKEVLHYRFNRYLDEEMYLNIEKFAIEITKHLDYAERQWSFTGYNCLNSIIYQHQNLMEIQEKFDISLPGNLEELYNVWALIRKKLFEYFSRGNVAIDDISCMLHKIAELEKKYAIKCIKEL